MLDRESELYHSGLLARETQKSKEHLALIVTREGVEVSAAAKGLRFEYSSTWDKIKSSCVEADRRFKAKVAENEQRLSVVNESR